MPEGILRTLYNSVDSKKERGEESLNPIPALLLESAKTSYIVKMFAKKNCPKNDKLYIFEKPLTMPFQLSKTFCKILNNLMCN